METTFVMVAGTRTLRDYDLVREKLDYYTRNLTHVTIVTGEWRYIWHGEARWQGADLAAERWASERKFPYRQFPPEFEKYPKNAQSGAFHARNREMVEFIAAQGGFAVVFWDCESPGTDSVINLLKKHGVEYRLVKF